MPQPVKLPSLVELGEITRNAGDIALSYWKNTPKNWQKSNDQGPVSEADLATDEYIKTALSAYPDIAILSEESEGKLDRLNTQHVAIIDPIDGTRAFLEGEDFFGTSIAIIKDGYPIMGAIYMPVLNQLFLAEKGGGASCNGKAMSISSAQRLGGKFLASKARYNQELIKKIPEISISFRPSIAYRLALIASGEFQGTFSMRPTWEWDIAAGDIICQEAGAIICDQDGNKPIYNQKHPQINGLFVGSKVTVSELLSRFNSIKDV